MSTAVGIPIEILILPALDGSTRYSGSGKVTFICGARLAARPESREICFEIWAKFDFDESFAKFGPDLPFRKRTQSFGRILDFVPGRPSLRACESV